MSSHSRLHALQLLSTWKLNSSQHLQSKCPFCDKSLKITSISSHISSNVCPFILEHSPGDRKMIISLYKTIISKKKSSIHELSPEEKLSNSIISIRSFEFRGRNLFYQCLTTSKDLIWISSSTMNQSRAGRMWIKRGLSLRKRNIIHDQSVNNSSNQGMFFVFIIHSIDCLLYLNTIHNKVINF